MTGFIASQPFDKDQVWKLTGLKISNQTNLPSQETEKFQKGC